MNISKNVTPQARIFMLAFGKIRSANMKESPFLNTEEAANYVRLDPRTLNNMRYRNAEPRYRKHGCKAVSYTHLTLPTKA